MCVVVCSIPLLTLMTAGSVEIYPISFILLIICIFSYFVCQSYQEFINSKSQFFVSLIFSIVLLFSISFIFTLMCIISILLFLLSLFCSFSSFVFFVFLKQELKLFISNFFSFPMLLQLHLKYLLCGISLNIFVVFLFPFFVPWIT